MLLTALFAGAAPARAVGCMHCGAAGGCESGGAYLLCSSGKFLNLPYCIALGGCGPLPTLGGGIDDAPLVRPRTGGNALTPAGEGAARARPEPRASARDAGLLTLYALRMPLAGGFDPFGARGAWWVERAMPATTTAAAMLGAVARRSRIDAASVPVCEESTSLGPGAYWVSLAAADGDGYALHAEAVASGTRVRVCAVRGRAPAGRVAEATLADGELLCVRVRGGGHDYALALVPRRVATEAWEAAEAARQERALFDLEAGPLTARAADDGVRFGVVDASPAVCP
jgi:hypothetical protein